MSHVHINKTNAEYDDTAKPHSQAIHRTVKATNHVCRVIP